jgi:hypothetical protein
VRNFQALVPNELRLHVAGDKHLNIKLRASLDPADVLNAELFGIQFFEKRDVAFNSVSLPKISSGV